MNSAIFKAYDIRGVYERELDAEIATQIGRAFVQVCAEGVAVLDAGEVATEVLYFLVGSRDLDGGLMCTASHNPRAYTGAKLVKRGAVALSGDSGIGEIRRLMDAGLPDPPGGGTHEEVDI